MWHDIQGHDIIVERFRRAAERNRLAGTFLFVGPPGIAKRTFAFTLARGILCKGNGGNSIEPCGVCDSCKLFGAESVSDFNPEEKNVSSHPDFFYTCAPPGKAELPLELLVGSKKNGERGKAGFCYDISRTPYLGHRKVAILDDADCLNEEGANALLKMLEEPPPDAVIILIGTSASKQLPTIRSRCQIVRFAPLPAKILANILSNRGIVQTLEQGLRLAVRAGGSYDQALELYDEAVDAVFQNFIKQLPQKHFSSVSNAAKINEFVEAAGKEAVLKRRRLNLFLHLVIHHFRNVLKESAAESPDFVPLTIRRLERTLGALEQVRRNVGLPIVVETWCNDLREPQ